LAEGRPCCMSGVDLPSHRCQPYSMESRTTQDARREFAALLEDVLRGQHIEITRYDRPLAVIVPVGWYEQARSALAASNARMKPGGQVIHKDGDIGNNELANLEVVYPEEGELR